MSLKVKDLIEYLQKLDPNANLAYGEQNGAMLGEGYWQHMADFMLPQCIRTVKHDKEILRRQYVQEDRMTHSEIETYVKKYEDAVKRDYKYVSDDDIIITI